jgi:MFS family permease
MDDTRIADVPGRRVVAGEIAARIDRLPVTWHLWAYALIVQTLWGSVLAMDSLVLRIYPVVWEPQHSFSPVQYALLVGFQNGLGVLIGQLWFTHLSDRVGRKPILILSCLVAGLLSWPLAITDNWLLLMVIVTAAGLGVGGAVGVTNVYLLELVPPTRRSRVMLGAQAWAAALLTLITSLLPIFLLPAHYQWWVAICAAIPVLVVVPLVLFLLPESPRWLESRGRAREADATMTMLENRVRTVVPVLPEPTPAGHEVIVAEKRVPVREVVQGVYLNRTIVLLLLWILGYLGVDYGMQSYQSVYLVKFFDPSELFTLLFVGGFIGTVGSCLVGALLSERVERKTLIGAAGIMSFLGAVLYFLFPSNFVVALIGTVLCSGAVLGWAFNSYTYTAAAYPTRLRSTAVGLTDGVGHTGAVLGPVFAAYFFTLTEHQNNIGWFLYFAVFGGLLPAAIIMIFGMKQRAAVLEEISR